MSTISSNSQSLSARISSSSRSTIVGKTSSGRAIEVNKIGIGTPGRLSELSDVDVTNLEQGAVLIYDESIGKFVAKSTMEDGTTIEGGHY
tara:strand:- start:41 stop:310 length:270 start_codon:yes stop_codon:yes gene_type:complete